MVSRIIYLLSICSLLSTLEGQAISKETIQNKREIRRVIALTSLSSDLVENLNKQVLVGIPGTTLTNND